MTEKTILESLDQDQVWLLKTVINDDGLEIARWRKGYANSNDVAGGRPAVQTEVEQPYKTAIFTVWGDTPTVDETTEV